MKPTLIFRQGKGLISDGKPLKSVAHPKASGRGSRPPKDISEDAVETIEVKVEIADPVADKCPLLGDQKPTPKRGKKPAPVIKVSRKVYLKLAARERRKREAEGAAKLGVTVASYRAMMSEKRKRVQT